MSLSVLRIVIIVLGSVAAAALWVGKVGIAAKPPELGFLLVAFGLLAFLVMAPAKGLSKALVIGLSADLVFYWLAHLLRWERSISTASPETVAAALSIGVAFAIASVVRFRFVASACLVTLVALGFFYKSSSVLTVAAWFTILTMLLVYSHSLFREHSDTGRHSGIAGNPSKGNAETLRPDTTPGGSPPSQNDIASDADPLQGILGIDVSPVGQRIVRRFGIILLLLQFVIILIFIIQHMGLFRDIAFRYRAYLTAVGAACLVWLLVLWGVSRIQSVGIRSQASLRER